MPRWALSDVVAGKCRVFGARISRAEPGYCEVAGWGYLEGCSVTWRVAVRTCRGPTIAVLFTRLAIMLHAWFGSLVLQDGRAGDFLYAATSECCWVMARGSR